MKRGVSLYSYQQAQFFKDLDLEAEIREVGTNLHGADGIEIVDEMSLRYPDPGQAFIRRWFEWMERYGTKPVAMDVGMDVLQFRDHVMTIEECADRLRHDIRLAKALGFPIVRVISVTPIEVMISALPLAESLNIRLGKEVHQPMKLEGPQVAEIVEFIERSGTRHMGIVPDFGIFQIRPSEVLLDWFVRRGAKPEACAASVELAELLCRREAPFGFVDSHTAGNVRSAFTRFLKIGDCEQALRGAFDGVKRFADERIQGAAEIDYTVVAEALMLSNTSSETLRQLAQAGHIVSVHAKCYNMSPIPGRLGEFQDISIDYPSAIRALREGGFQGYVDSEYEGQRYFQDRTRAELMDEVDQVRRHQEMLRRLIGT